MEVAVRKTLSIFVGRFLKTSENELASEDIRRSNMRSTYSFRCSGDVFVRMFWMARYVISDVSSALASRIISVGPMTQE